MSVGVEDLKVFFEDNKGFLEQNYPGINLKRIAQEIGRLPHNISVRQFFEKLKQGVPLQYISGKAWFYNHEFLVTPDVLIPRFETELLVEKALLWLESNHKNKVCDIGTGSGIILLSIAANTNRPVEGLGIDISDEALEVAKRNYYLHRFAMNKKTNLDFIIGDRLAGIGDQYDLIVSNPPYIREEADKKLVHDQVDKYEPKLALYLPDEHYDDWFRLLFTQSFDRLTDRGLFLMEGHEHHLEGLSQLARQTGFKNVAIESDLTGRARFLRGEKWTN